MPSIHQVAPASVCAPSEWSSIASQILWFFWINIIISLFLFLQVKQQMAVKLTTASRRPHPLENIKSNHWGGEWTIKVLIPLNIFSAGVSSSIPHSRTQGYISCCNILQHHFEPWCIIKNNNWVKPWLTLLFFLPLTLFYLLINSKMFFTHRMLIRGRAGALFWRSCECVALLTKWRFEDEKWWKGSWSLPSGLLGEMF